MKLLGKARGGARVRRRYDTPRTPLERVLACAETPPDVAARLQQQRDRPDPFALARVIEQRLARIYALANPRHRPSALPTPVPRPVRHRLSIKPSPHLTPTPPRSVTSETAR